MSIVVTGSDKGLTQTMRRGDSDTDTRTAGDMEYQ